METDKITYNHERYLLHIDTVAIALITHGLTDFVIDMAKSLNALYESPFMRCVVNSQHKNVRVKDCLRVYLEEKYK